MNRFALFSFCSVLFVGCMGAGGGNETAARVMDSRLAGYNQYEVVVVMDGISRFEAKRRAKQRAAEITVQNGGQYFVIDNEETAKVMKGEQPSGNQRFYGNMYQELIIEKDFGRERLENQPSYAVNTYSAVRLTFTIVPNRRFGAIDACKFTDCD